MVEQSQKQLPAGIEQALVDLGNSLWTRNFSGTQIKDIVAGLGVLPAQAIIGPMPKLQMWRDCINAAFRSLRF